MQSLSQAGAAITHRSPLRPVAQEVTAVKDPVAAVWTAAVGLSLTRFASLLSRDRDGYHRLDHFRTSGNRHRFEQVCEMENPRQTGARPGGHGSGTP